MKTIIKTAILLVCIAGGFSHAQAADVTLSWNALQHADKYKLMRKKAGDANFTQAYLGSAVRHQDTGLAQSNYTYKVIGCITNPQTNTDLCEQVAHYSPELLVNLNNDSGIPLNVEIPQAAATHTLPSPDTVSSQVGLMPGSFRVDESGAATYSIPLQLPEGIAGVTPQLALNYSSLAGNGVMGVGWSIGGLSSISRCRQTKEQDNAVMPLTLTNNDRFCLDGQKLIAVSGSYGADGTEYRTETDSQRRIISKGSAGTGPAYFTVESTDGSIQYYGGQDAAGTSRSDSVLKINTTAVSWMLASISDNIGAANTAAPNHIVFSYQRGDGTGNVGLNEIVLDKINYSGHKVDLVYANNAQRSDLATSYLHGLEIKPKARLSSINIHSHASGNTAIRSYGLGYDNQSDVTRIERIQQTGLSGTSLPETVFDWYENAEGHYQNTGNRALKNHEIVTFNNVDLDGDSYADFVYLVKNRSNFKFFVQKNVNGSLSNQSTPLGVWFNIADTNKTPVIIPGDIDGDGELEFLYFKKVGTKDIWHAYDFGSGSDVSLGVSLQDTNGSESVVLQDINADALPDLVYGGTQLKYKLNKKDRFSRAYNLNLNATNDSGYDLNMVRKIFNSPVDFNGDGRADVVVKIHSFDELCNSYDGLFLRETRLAVYSLFKVNDVYQYQFLKEVEGSRQSAIVDGTCGRGRDPYPYEKVIVGDVNSDGLTDFIYGRGDTWRLHISTGKGFAAQSTVTLKNASGQNLSDSDVIGLQLVDINQDGYQDLLYFNKQDKRWQSHAFNPNSMTFATNAVVELYQPAFNNNRLAFAADWDADGIPGFAMLDFNQKKLYTHNDPYVQNDTPNNALKSITNGFGAKTEIHYGPMTDASLYTKGQGASSIGNYGRGSPVFDVIAPTYLVKKVTSDSPGYSSAGTYDANGTVSVQYHYTGMRAQAGGRGMLGFEKITTYDPGHNVTTETQYHQDFPYIGMPKSTLKYLGARVDNPETRAQLLSKAVNTYQKHSLHSNKVVFQYLYQSDETSYSLNDAATSTREISKTKTVNTYNVNADNHADLAKVEVSQLDASGSLVAKTTTRNTYAAAANNIAKWWLGRVTNTKVTHYRPGASPATRQTIARESDFAYYPASTAHEGMLQKEIVQPRGGVDKTLTTLHCYDTFGNKQESITYSNSFSPSCSANPATQNAQADSVFSGASNLKKIYRRSYSKYDAQGRYVVKTGNDKFTTQTINRRNTLGQATQTTDINGVVSHIAYDAFGNAYASKNGTGQYTQTTRRLANSAYAIGAPNIGESYHYVERSINAGKPTAYAYFDKQGRQVASVKQGFNSGEWLHQYSRYDKLGNRLQHSIPVKVNGTGSASISNWHTTTYDRFARVDYITAADKTRSEVTYNGLTTTTSVTTGDGKVSNQSQSESKNILGETVKVTDALNNDTTYYYDATGNLTKVTGVDNLSIITQFDDLGRKTQTRDPNKETWHYAYNALGELVQQQDANGHTTHFNRDSVGRTLTRSVSGNGVNEITRYTFNAHQLKQECILNGASCDASQPSKNLLYDRLGRVDLVTTMLDGENYTQQTTYDQYNRVFQQFDPEKHAIMGCTNNGAVTSSHCWGIRNHYNANGYLFKQVEARNSAGTPKVYYQAHSMDAYGNITQFKQNDGKVSSVRAYKPTTGYIDSITAHNGALIQNNRYTFDGIGNLRSRTRNSLKASFANKSERFKYDDLNRLTYINDDKKVQYFANGNIQWKKGTGYYCYNAAKPHAVSAIGSDGCTTKTFSYDNNGNMKTGLGRSITYSHFDKPTRISKNGTTEFAYDTARKRYKRITHSGGKNTKTYYIGNLEVVYEQQNGSYQHTETRRYLPSAIQTHYSTGAHKTRYLHKDHLGSIDSITDDNGKLVEKLYFDAWGKKQSIARGFWDVNSAFVATTLINVLELTPRGFNGHEHVDHADIIHMNGRIYDPTLGRFLQADPHIQAPKNSQSYNRYSYVLNNPLSYTDPSGYFFKKLFKFVKKYWKPIVAAIATVITYGAASGWVSAWGATWGTAATATSAATLTWAGGAAAGAMAGFVGGAVATGSLKGALRGAFSGAVFGGIGSAGWGTEATLGAHSLAGGAISDLQGGNFGHGFWTAGIMKAVGIVNTPGANATMSQIAGRAVVQAMVGGTLSKVTGGKFANGAATAAIQYVVNGISDKINGWVNKQKAKWEAAKKVKAIDIEMSRLKGLYLNDQKALKLELETFYGFEGGMSDLRYAYTSLQLELTTHRTQALYTAVSGMRPAIKPGVTAAGGLKPDIGAAIGAWPLIALTGTVTYSTSYTCGVRICGVEEFLIHD